MTTAHPSDPAVAAFVAAVNADDKDTSFATLADDATMSDDGTARDLAAWAEREIFTTNGRMDIEDVPADGRTLTATYTNATCGSMRTR